MNSIEKHLRNKLELSYDTINQYGVRIVSDGQSTLTQSCPHPEHYSDTIQICFGSVNEKDLMIRFGIRKFSHLKLLTPQQIQIVFEG